MWAILVGQGWYYVWVLITALLKLGSGSICSVLVRSVCHLCGLHSPHVDQVLCESDRLGVARHGDGAVHAHPHAAQPAAAPAARRGRIAVLAV